VSDADPGAGRDARPDAAADAAAVLAEQIGDTLSVAPPPSDEVAEALRERVAARQREVGYQDYKSWREKIGPPC